jgi:hypothetical protein
MRPGRGLVGAAAIDIHTTADYEKLNQSSPDT